MKRLPLCILLFLFLFCVAISYAQRPNVNDVMTWTGSNGKYKPIVTTTITEGMNLFYTDARARLSLSVTTPLLYNSITGLINCSLSSVSPLVYDSTVGKFNLKGLNGLGAAFSVVSTDSAGQNLKYRRLVAGSNVTIANGGDSMVISSSGGGGTAANWRLKASTGSPNVSNLKILTVDVSNGLSLSSPGDTTATLSIPSGATLSLGTLNVTSINTTSLAFTGISNSLPYILSSGINGLALGGTGTVLMGTSATTAPVFGGIVGSYGLDTVRGSALLTLRTDTTKLATVNSVNLKANSAVTITAGAGLIGTHNLSSSFTLGDAASGVVAGTYGDSRNVLQATIGTGGRISSASSVHITHADSSDYGYVTVVPFYLRSGTDSTFISVPGMTSTGSAGAFWATNKSYTGAPSAVTTTNGVFVFTPPQSVDSLLVTVAVLRKQ